MGRGKTDYSKGLIYKLCCKDPNIKQIYIGSTVNFRVRKNTHKTKCNNPKTAEYSTKKYIFIREHGGWENWEMILIEYYSATDLRDLEQRERYWFDELSSKLNTNKPYISEEEKKNYNIERGKIYRKNNREKELKRKYEWRKNNKEKYKKSKKKSDKKYRENNKEYIVCECSSKILKLNYKNHLKTNKHIKFLENKTQ